MHSRLRMVACLLGKGLPSARSCLVGVTLLGAFQFSGSSGVLVGAQQGALSGKVNCCETIRLHKPRAHHF